MAQTRLVRSETDKMLAGVCGGLATYLNIDSVFVRLAFVVLGLASGIGLPIYLVLWIVMPAASAAEVIGEDVYTDPSSLKSGNAVAANPGGTIGIILVVLGLFFLLNQLGWMNHFFWPLILILGGVYFIIRRNR